MPRATHNSNRLYTSEITALQRTLRLTSVDKRIPKTVKERIARDIANVVDALNEANKCAATKVDNVA